MSFANKYNKGNNIFDIDITDYEYVTLYDTYKNIDSDVLQLDGLFINSKARYPHAVAVNKDNRLLVDLPSHMNDTVRDILNDAESINLIKKGCVGFKIRPYHSEQYAKDCFSVDWVDL